MIAKLFAMSSQNAMIQNDPSEKKTLWGFSYSKNMTNCEAILLEPFSRNTNPCDHFFKNSKSFVN